MHCQSNVAEGEPVQWFSTVTTEHTDDYNPNRRAQASHSPVFQDSIAKPT